MALTISDKFCGKVVQEHYQQPVCKDGFGFWVGVFESQTFEFTGLTYTEAMTDTSVTVTDVGGTQYTFTLSESYTDSSTGSAFFAKEECKISRRRVSPHMWAITFTRVGGKLLLNGEKYYDGPTWMDHYNT